MPHRMILRQVSFMAHFKARRCEWMLSFVALALGFAYLDTPGLFARIDFRGMGGEGAQLAWGYAITALALVRLSMLWINGAWRVSPYFRAAGAALCMVLWGALFALQSLSVAPPQTRWIWLVVAIFDALNAGEAALDAGVASVRGKGDNA